MPDKTGSDLRNVLRSMAYTLYVEALNPTYLRMLLKKGDNVFVVCFSGEVLSINGVPSSLGDIPSEVDTVNMY